MAVRLYLVASHLLAAVVVVP